MENTNISKNTPKSICAIQAAVPAMPPKPNTAAKIATTKNVNAQPIMVVAPLPTTTLGVYNYKV